MNKYLSVLSTVLSPHELHVTTRHVTEFMTPGGWADTLQEYLLERQEDTNNWAVDWWLDHMYLRNRLPLAINSNAAILLSEQRFANTEEYLRWAIPVEMANGTTPLCMDQEYRRMSSCRIPGIPSDHIVSLFGKQRPPYIVVARNNQFYRVDVEQDGECVSEGEVLTQLWTVLTAAQHHTAGAPPMGILTALDRSTWAEARQQLAQVEENRRNLETIEQCMFLLCLDTHRAVPAFISTPSTREEAKEEEELTKRMLYCLHGMGSDFHSCNRWFDKPMQILLTESGDVCANCEHSLGDGNSFLTSVKHALEYCASHGQREEKAEQETHCLREPVWLKWTTTRDIEDYIDRAKVTLDRNARNIDITAETFGKFGGAFLKSQGVSPDVFVQLALQFAYYRLHGRMAMSYESASLRRFQGGRMDNVRANSPAALAWIQAMCGEAPATANAGYGIDCHLIGLQEAARDLGVLDSIPLFSDPAFQKLFCFPLSTSQTPPAFPSFYGPATLEGYGLPYRIFPDRLFLIVTSFRDCAETESRKFLSCLRSCLLEMQDSCLTKN
ncbi:hypothetical protein ACOMHN_058104 [Nucella lapillus]